MNFDNKKHLADPLIHIDMLAKKISRADRPKNLTKVDHPVRRQTRKPQVLINQPGQVHETYHHVHKGGNGWESVQLLLYIPINQTFLIDS